MYPVSNAYKQAMHARVQSFRITGNIGNVSFTDENILAGSLSINNQCSSSENIDIGQVYIGELNCTFINVEIERYSWQGKQIIINFGQRLLNGSYEDIPLGIFTISQAEYTKSGVVVKAYDNMAKLDKTCSSFVTGTIPYNIVKSACDDCHLELETSISEFENFANGRVTLSIFGENDINTYRDVISWIAQTCGCFVTASRSGGLLFKKYNENIVDTLNDSQRFSNCSFADYTTRYTGMSVVNISQKTTSYYALSPDNALTYNLGSNPYLQTPVSHSLTAMRRNVLNALAKINYVPFKATCIGNPAYDLGDVLVFSGGLADGTKKYCITKYSWTYGRDYVMEGVGKNPVLANGHSKSDKNIAGLLSQAVTDDYKVMVMRNGADIKIEDGESKSVLFSRYLLSSSNSHVRFNIEILLVVNANASTDNLAQVSINNNNTLTLNPVPSENKVVVKVTYKVDSEEITTYSPIETWSTGKHILTLQYDLEHNDTLAHSFDVWLNVTGGSIYIAPNDAREAISSTGLASDNDWDGTFRDQDGNLYIVINGQAHKVPDSIIVYKYPNKISYTLNELLDFTGVVIHAVYGDKTWLDVTSSCVFSPAENTPYDQNNVINVTYTEYGLNYATSFDLTYNGIIRIEMDTLPNKLNYEHGETITYAGAKVVAVYKDNTRVDITNDCVFLPEAGTSFDYDTLRSKSGLKTLAISSPSKTSYAIGDFLDYSGCYVWAYFTDGSYQNVTSEAVFSPANNSLITNSTRNKVLVSFTDENNETISSSFDINIARLRDIIITPPTVTHFKAGQLLDYSGVVVTASYTNGTTRDVTANAVFVPSAGTAASTSLSSIVVAYTDNAGNSKTNTFSVNVGVLTGIFATQPNKSEYRLGDTISYTGMTVTARYSDGTTENVTANVTCTPAAGSVITNPNITSATIRYTDSNGNTATTITPISITTMTEITVDTLPNKTAYNIGDTLDLTGIVVHAVYSDESVDIVTPDCVFTPYDGATLTAEDDQVNVSYMNKGNEIATTNFSISVGAHVLSSLNITPPTKTQYRYGEIIDYSGLAVVAVYSDGVSEAVNIANVSISPADESIFTSNQNVTAIVTYTDSANTTVTGTFTLYCKALNSISIVLLPTKTSFIVGQAVDYSGCLVRANYVDGTVEDVSASCTFTPSQGSILSTVTSNQQVTVEYNNKTTTFSLEVLENSVTEISITDNFDTSNIVSLGDTWDFSDVTVNAVFADGSSNNITSSCTFSPANGSVIADTGDVSITVSYGNVSKTFERPIVGDTNFLPYVVYTQSDVNKTITITGLNFAKVMSDKPSDIIIYSKININNTIYDIIIN